MSTKKLIPKFQTSGQFSYRPSIDDLLYNEGILNLKRGYITHKKEKEKEFNNIMESVSEIANGALETGDYDLFRSTLDNFNDDVRNAYFKNNSDVIAKLPAEFQSQISTDYKDMFNDPKSLIGTEYKRFNLGSKDNMATEERPYGAVGLLGPLTDAASVGVNWNQLRKAKDEALKITSPRVAAATAPVRPIQSLAPEIVGNHNTAKAAMQVKKTSDATANIIANDLLNMRKLSKDNAFAEQQANNLQVERARYDKAKSENAIRSVDAMNKQHAAAIDIANQKALTKADYEIAKKDLFTNALGQVKENINNAATYNAAIEAQSKSNAKQKLSELINIAEYRLNDNTLDATKRGAIETDLNTYLNNYGSGNYEPYKGESLPTYWQVKSKAILPNAVQWKKPWKQRNGGKLIAKKHI